MLAKHPADADIENKVPHYLLPLIATHVVQRNLSLRGTSNRIVEYEMVNRLNDHILVMLAKQPTVI